MKPSELPEFLFKGAWFALEQSGHLFAVTASLYNNSDRIWLAAGLGILALEEMGKAAELYDWSERDLKGKWPKPSALINKDHRVKQWNGLQLGGVTGGLAADSEIGSLLTMLGASIRDRERFKEIGTKLADAMQRLRENTFFLGLANYSAGWIRPDQSCSEGLALQILIIASNSYGALKHKLEENDRFNAWKDRPKLPTAPCLKPSATS